MPWKATHRPKAQTAPKTRANAVSVVHVTVTAVTAVNATVKHAKTTPQKKARPTLLHRLIHPRLHKLRSDQRAVHTLNVLKLQLRQRLRQRHRTQNPR